MKKIYIASDLFSQERRDIINRFAKALRLIGHEVYVPHEHSVPNGNEMNNSEWAKKVFAEDVAAIDACDDLLYICEGMTGDIGSAWECGYAYAKGKTIRVEELNEGDGSGKISLMVAQSSSTEIFRYQS